MIQHLAALFASEDSIVFVTRLDDQRLVGVSPAFERLSGIPASEAIGRTAVELGLWPDARARQTVIDQMLRRGMTQREAVTAQARDGSYYDGLITCEVIEHDGVKYLFSLLQDVRRHVDQAQAHARESLGFRSLFTQAEIGVYRVWPGARGYLDVNPAFAALLGFASPEAFMAEHQHGKPGFYADPAQGAAIREALARHGRISRVRSQWRRRDGVRVWVSENARAVNDASGALLFYEGTVADVSAEVSAQAALEQSERLYRSLVENCRDGVFLMQHGNIVFCNEALGRGLGYSAQDLLGSSYFALVAPEDLAAQRVRRAAREGGSMDVQDFEIHLMSRGGERRLFEVRAGAVIFNGEPASIGTMRDVTGLRRQQQRLADTEERYRLAVWGSGDRLFDWNLETGLLTQVGTEPDGAPGLALPLHTVDGLAEYLHPDDFPDYRGALLDHIAGKTSFFEASYRLRSRAGTWQWKLARGMIVARDAEGRPARISGTQKDITRIKTVESDLMELTRELDARVQVRTRELQQERLELEAANQQLTATIEALRRTQSELIESEKMASLGRLVAGVAHEVNTPLGVGLTAISYLRDQLVPLKRQLAQHLPPEQVERLVEPLASAGAMAENNLYRAAELVRSFKRVAVDQSTSSIRAARLREYLDEILQSLHPLLKQHRASVVLECHPELRVRTRLDALYQVVSNLVTNSVRHGYPDGRAAALRLLIVPAEEQVQLRYADDGVGMDAEVARRLYEPFFTTQREQGGTGLGMHIVYNLVTQALAGRIACNTAPGQGTAFEIVFPAVHPGAEALAAGAGLRRY